MKPPLQGIRVLDLSTVLSGPIAAALLADQGAEVTKVESPEGDTSRYVGPAKGDLSAMYIAVNRGKRSIALDLKAPGARPILERLVQRADVLINNFRPGVMARLGLADEQLAALNPRLVRLSITGYGTVGPAAGDKVYDTVVQAVGGVAATQRDAATGHPTLLSTAVCDKLTAITGAQAVLSALFARERDGLGHRIDLSMLDAVLAFQWPDAMYNHVFMDEPPPPFPEFGMTMKPWKTRDGFVATMAPQQAEFIGLCKALGREDIAADPRFESLKMRSRHSRELRALLEPLMAAFTTDELVAKCREHGSPIGRVNERHEVLADAQVQASGALQEIEHGDAGRVRLAGYPGRFDGERLPPPGPAAHLGQHGPEILAELGFDAAATEQFIRDGVVRLPATAT